MLTPAVEKEPISEVREELRTRSHLLHLSDDEFDHIATITGWIASEAYWRGYNRLAPPDF